MLLIRGLPLRRRGRHFVVALQRSFRWHWASSYRMPLIVMVTLKILPFCDLQLARLHMTGTDSELGKGNGRRDAACYRHCILW